MLQFSSGCISFRCYSFPVVVSVLHVTVFHWLYQFYMLQFSSGCISFTCYSFPVVVSVLDGSFCVNTVIVNLFSKLVCWNSVTSTISTCGMVHIYGSEM